MGWIIACIVLFILYILFWAMLKSGSNEDDLRESLLEKEFKSHNKYDILSEDLTESERKTVNLLLKEFD